ncbi:phytanoyl-CoA dioxygenase domain-containing protein 1-like [Biomphalaria glabrata]|uniref:Phytanoyl-CoA dioxygenase domain-containing protein 1-like n=1 Tax=Biomphalaria glabrata TaxID=6526 RepID=A0A9W2YSH1_BIOGL|nr:phytanoyl-CoA dioxygenase domain-containing protein 1-like [Biomphalaria glabrata]
MSDSPLVRDWSLDHETSEPFLNLLRLEVRKKDDWLKHRLSEEDIKRYQANGYINHVQVLTHEQCDLLLQEYRCFMENDLCQEKMELLYEYHRNQTGDENNVLMHALGHWRVSPLFHDLVFLPSVVVKVSQLLNPGTLTPVRFWHDQLFAKPAKHGGVVAWHQDYSYWTRTRPMQHITVHIALEDQTEDNGTIQYIPGSHRWNRNGEPLPILDFNFKDMEIIKSILTPEELEQFKPEPANLHKGEASFHHALSVHGSYENRSDQPRRAAVLNYFADGTLSDVNTELLKGSFIPKGQRMSGQLYPLVYSPEW